MKLISIHNHTFLLEPVLIGTVREISGGFCRGQVKDFFASLKKSLSLAAAGGEILTELSVKCAEKTCAIPIWKGSYFSNINYTASAVKNQHL